MSDDSGGLLPLVDRRAPVIERVRSRNIIGGDEPNNLISKALLDTSTTSDENEREKKASQYIEEIRGEMAEAFEVEESDIKRGALEPIARVLTLGKEDVVAVEALEELGISEVKEELPDEITDAAQNGLSDETDEEVEEDSSDSESADDSEEDGEEVEFNPT